MDILLQEYYMSISAEKKSQRFARFFFNRDKV